MEPVIKVEIGYDGFDQLLLENLSNRGYAIVRNPHANWSSEFLPFKNLMEQYFSSDGIGQRQVNGITPEKPFEEAEDEIKIRRRSMRLKKDARSSSSYVAGSTSMVEPTTYSYFWRIGPRHDRPCSLFPNELSEHPPSAQIATDKSLRNPRWEEILNTCGTRMFETAKAVVRMLERSMSLPYNTQFTDMIRMGPHVLVSKGTDLSGQNCQEGAVIEPKHCDYNFLSVYGAIPFMGMLVWTPSGEVIEVHVPVGCSLIIPGKQLEYLTSGYIQASKHKVSVTAKTIAAVKEAETIGTSLWRASAALYVHVDPIIPLRPLTRYYQKDNNEYHSLLAGQFMEEEFPQHLGNIAHPLP